MHSSQTVEKGAFPPWPPLRGGSARRRWGRELYGCPKYFGLWQGPRVDASIDPYAVGADSISARAM